VERQELHKRLTGDSTEDGEDSWQESQEDRPDGKWKANGHICLRTKGNE
jgi:hypothetical protein